MRVALSDALLSIGMWQSQNLGFVVKQALKTVSVHYSWLHIPGVCDCSVIIILLQY